MNLWTTFCPSKIIWELTTIQTKGKAASSDWLKHQELIEKSLYKLKTAGIVGIRLVVFPTELTKDGNKYNWNPIDTILSLCARQELAVDLCIGPFQYPYYPGIFLPSQMQKHVSEELYLDTNPALREYGMRFLKLQMERYGTDKRIRGFHLANEWPDIQRVAGQETTRAGVSSEFMLHAAIYLKKVTTKPILLNTNIDAGDKQKLAETFGNLLKLLGKQARLGFDIYPSQETWMKVPLQKLRRLKESYKKSFAWSCDRFAPCEIYFAEVEAQPWGNGQSWYQLIQKEDDPSREILTYTPESLEKTWGSHIRSTDCKEVSLWGADFWLSSDALGISWPLEAVKNAAS